MKHIKLIILLVVFLATTKVQSQNPNEVTLPRTASPAASISQTIGISKVSIEYSRPSVRNREVWGNLAHYGLKKQNFGPKASVPWRAGANENTIITFTHDANVEGKPVPAGSYGLFFIVYQNNTAEIILSKEYQSWGHFKYDSLQDQMRAKIQTRAIPHVEMLTYDFINLTKNSGELVLNWDKKQFPVVIEFNVDGIVMENAYQELKGSKAFNSESYTSAANYALQNNVNNKVALEWIDNAIGRNKNIPNLSIKSGLLKQSGRNEDADKLMKEALTLTNTTEFEMNNYGYTLLGNKEYDKAIEVFVLNTKRFPESANAWDSLGEAYFNKGDKSSAVKSFKKSLSLNPTGATKDNSEKFLKQMDAL